MIFTLRKLLFFFLFVSVFQAFSQKDTLKFLAETKQKPILVINADFRQSFIRNSPITIYGGYLGLKYKQKHLYSLGFYTLSDSSKRQYKALNQKLANPNKSTGGSNPTTPTTPTTAFSDEASLWFLSFGYTRTIYDGKIFKIDIPVEIGLGEASSAVYGSDGNLVRLNTGLSAPLQIGVSTTVKITRWFGIHLQAGHREMLGKSIFQNEYTGLYYTYGINLNFGRIYKDLKK